VKTKREKPSKTPTSPETNGIQKIGENTGGMKKMPSNAPTMAIAPSDYEHIFHEGAAGGSPAAADTFRQPATPPPPPPPPQPVAPPRQYGYQGAQNKPSPAYGRTYDQPQAQPGSPTGQDVPLQITADGYTLLGQQPDDSSRRIALPPHIVRANNQFSRSALVKIANYLASRADSY